MGLYKDAKDRQTAEGIFTSAVFVFYMEVKVRKSFLQDPNSYTHRRNHEK